MAKTSCKLYFLQIRNQNDLKNFLNKKNLLFQNLLEYPQTRLVANVLDNADL